jgi:hypothetical protein
MNFQPNSDSDARDDLFPIEGEYKSQDKRIEFRALRRSPLGASISLDGVIRKQDQTWRLQAIYILLSGTGNRLVAVNQELSLNPGKSVKLAKPSQATGVVDTKNTATIFDLEIPFFDVTIEPLEGFHTVAPHQAQLMFEPFSDTHFYLSLVSQGALVPGWINWDIGALRRAKHWRGTHFLFSVTDAADQVSLPRWYVDEVQPPLSLRRIELDLVRLQA